MITTHATRSTWPLTDPGALEREERKSPATLLVVDDTEANRYALSRILKNAGYRVVECGTGTDALERVAALRPDLVVLDVRLPDLAGWDVCRKIKSNPATALIPVLHVSASYVTEHDRAHGLNQGADGYLVQPIDPSVLVATVRALLRLKRATEALITTEARLDTVLSNTPGMVFAVDARAECTLARGRALGEWHLTSETAVGRPFSEALPNDEFRRHVARALAGERFIDELRLADKWYELCFAPLPELHGSPAGFVCLVNDITERRRDERMRERLLAHVAEDLRNPVYGIKVTTAALKQALNGPDLSHDYLEQAVNKIARLADLADRFVSNLSDYERMQSGKIAIQRKNNDLCRLLRQAIDTMQPLADSRSIKLDAMLSDPTCMIACDGERLLQVFASAIGHALQYTPARGTVRVALRTGDNDVTVAIDHDGVAIAEGALPHSFDGHRAHDMSGAALAGLGQSLANAIVAAHGGRIEDQTGTDRRARVAYILPRQ